MVKRASRLAELFHFSLVYSSLHLTSFRNRDEDQTTAVGTRLILSEKIIRPWDKQSFQYFNDINFHKGLFDLRVTISLPDIKILIIIILNREMCGLNSLTGNIFVGIGNVAGESIFDFPTWEL
ncbi:MAG: hypothetical protein C5B59_19050 [Bacteroidetes bacterium]|nr:MAG: hypothetical protein C5B59_19050 [Bacteroidota bacterium]